MQEKDLACQILPQVNDAELSTVNKFKKHVFSFSFLEVVNYFFKSP